MIFLIGMLILYGCTMHSREYFVSLVNDSVGKSIDSGYHSYGPPGLIEKIPINNSTLKYTYRMDSTGCEWFYIVEADTHKISSWGYKSNPNKCYIKLKGLGK